ncbi:MAG: hypothetical protein LLF76_04215 [Planctomycetaceae bacterium]|nr:hypothetical protein [Planctomycetaceae bacterium]
MPLSRHIILGIHVHDRPHHIPGVQNLLTEFGCSIRTRIGLHDTGEGYCSPNGLILVEMTDDEPRANDLLRKLDALDGVEVQKMVFDHA